MSSCNMEAGVRKLLLFLFGIAFGALMGPAAAADMPVKAPAPLPPSWSGFYAGFNAGYGDLQNTVYTAASGTPDAALGTTPGVSTGLAVLSSRTIPVGSGAGFAGGGQIGYNLQFNKLWLGGIEADIQGVTGSNRDSITTGTIVGPNDVPVTSTQTASVSTKYLGTVRARFGILFTPAWYLYATGGVAYGGTSVSSTLAQSAFRFAGTSAGSVSDTRIGGAFGGGLEWMFAPRLTTKVEYLHYDLGTGSASFPATSSSFATPVYQNVLTSSHFQGNLVRVGLNYLF